MNKINAAWLFASIVRHVSDRALAARASGNSELEDQLAEVLWGAGKVLRAVGFSVEATWTFDQYAIAAAMDDH